jgi:Rha family phage regulatory protein
MYNYTLYYRVYKDRGENIMIEDKIKELFGLVDKETNTVSSIEVAGKFNKRHSDLLRSIDKQVLPNISEDFAERNITLCFKNNDLQNGKPQKHYTLTKDGFMMVAMSLTGKEAYLWKEAFILRFNQVAEENQIMKDIVWKVIKDKSYLGRMYALQSAGVKHPRLFLRYLQENGKFHTDVHERGLLKHQHVSPNTLVEMFTRKGFEWLLANKSNLDTWVEKQKVLEKQRKVLPC